MSQPVEPASDGQDSTIDLQELLQGGDSDHLAAARQAAHPVLVRIAQGLGLIGQPLAQLGPPAGDRLSPNVIAGVACLASAFRGLRAATLLAMNGYPSEARAIVRRTYEAATLARMLAHEPALAEKWLKKGQWFPDVQVRQWFGVQSTPGEQRSAYQEYYNNASAYAHPTLRSTGALLLTADDTGHLSLNTGTDIVETLVVLQEIAAETVFVGLAFRNGLVDPKMLSPAWHQHLDALAAKAGVDLPNLRADWAEGDRAYDRFLAAVMPAEEVDTYLREHPNSYDNVRSRGEL